MNKRIFEFFEHFGFFVEMNFGIFGVSWIISWYFEYRIRIRCSFLYMGTYFKDYFRLFRNKQNRYVPRSMNTFRTKYFGGLFGVVGVLNGPPPQPHPRRQCQSSLLGKNQLKKRRCLVFCWDLLGFWILNGPPTSLKQPPEGYNVAETPLGRVGTKMENNCITIKLYMYI